jgi:two-component system chemotaxis response regulator CheB
MTEKEKINVLVVDDSSAVTMALKRVIDAQPDMVVYAVASDPFEAVKVIRGQIPDVMILDVQMPRMDGLTFLEKVMKQHPIPVIIFSGVAEYGSENAIKAMRLGALSIISKPGMIINNHKFIYELANSIRIAFAARERLGKFIFRNRYGLVGDRKPVNAVQKILTDKLIAIGASTGGTQAIQFILSHLSRDVPGVVIVQHMPGNFTKWFAESLNRITPLEVYEATSGKIVHRGEVYIANGFFHLAVKRTADKIVLSVFDGKEENRHKPSVDVLFNSVAEKIGEKAVGILLTGMGDDGAKGLLNMKNAGAFTIAQDEASSVVFGMPREAFKINAVDEVMDLNKIISFINNL